MFQSAIQKFKRRSHGLIFSCILAGILLPTTIERCSEIWNRPTNWGHNAAADARRIFLAGIAARMGLDPTEPASLKKAYEMPEAQKVPMEMPTNHAAGKYSDFATMYPATLAPLMIPFAKHSWVWFLYWWRYLIFGTFVVGLGFVGAGVGRSRWAPVAIVVAVLAGLHTPHSILDICLRIGQANLFVAGIMGMAIGLTAHGANRSAVLFGLLGACVKLVPAIALGPILIRFKAREWGWAIGLTIGILIAVSYWTPVERFVDDLFLIAGQQKMARSHLLVNAGSGLLWLEWFRVLPMGALSMLATALATWRVRKNERQSAEVLCTGIALMSLWLGTAASAIMDHYSILLVPGMIFVSLWPLRRNAPAWSWILLPAIVGPAYLVPFNIEPYHELLSLVLIGTTYWFLCLLQLTINLKKTESFEQNGSQMESGNT